MAEQKPVETEITIVVVQGERITYWRLDPDAEGVIAATTQHDETGPTAAIHIDGKATRVVLVEDTDEKPSDVAQVALQQIADSLGRIETTLAEALGKKD